jgi:hypothetical protein
VADGALVRLPQAGEVKRRGQPPDWGRINRTSSSMVKGRRAGLDAAESLTPRLSRLERSPGRRTLLRRPGRRRSDSGDANSNRHRSFHGLACRLLAAMRMLRRTNRQASHRSGSEARIVRGSARSCRARGLPQRLAGDAPRSTARTTYTSGSALTAVSRQVARAFRPGSQSHVSLGSP